MEKNSILNQLRNYLIKSKEEREKRLLKRRSEILNIINGELSEDFINGFNQSMKIEYGKRTQLNYIDIKRYILEHNMRIFNYEELVSLCNVIAAEEKVLREKYGKDFDDYKIILKDRKFNVINILNKELSEDFINGFNQSLMIEYGKNAALDYVEIKRYILKHNIRLFNYNELIYFSDKINQENDERFKQFTNKLKY